MPVWLLILLGFGALAAASSGNKGTGSGSVTVKPKDTPDPKKGGGANPGPSSSLPPAPSIAAVSSPVYTAPSYVPSDSPDPATMANTARMTVRQLQAGFNLLGANPPLQVNGNWDLATRQAVWDWQYHHENDDPQSPLNVTGEIDQLTQNSIQAAIGKKAGVPTGFY